jgi:4,4'-diaponeurosporenoate glycosyltransferase
MPDGWRGKPWACHQGALAAKGSHLLFLDADCWFEPGGLDAVLRHYQGGAFSVAPHHRVERPYEELSALFNVIMVASTAGHGLFGQSLLVDRASYQAAGGHLEVKGRVLENLRLAAFYRAAGVPVASIPGRGMLSFRMYPDGLRSLVEGWTKGFAWREVATGEEAHLASWSGRPEHHEGEVEVADMVAGDDRRPFGREVFEPMDGRSQAEHPEASLEGARGGVIDQTHGAPHGC